MFLKLRKLISDAFDDSRFIIQISSSRVKITKGKVSPRFLADIAEFVASHALVSGVIRGKRQDTYIRIIFSSEIPTRFHQQLRNIWHVHEPNFQSDTP